MHMPSHAPSPFSAGAQQSDRSALTHADAVASEAVTSIKTVAAFNMQVSGWVARYSGCTGGEIPSLLLLLEMLC